MQSTIQIEMNSTTDNPLVFPEKTVNLARLFPKGISTEKFWLYADRMSLSIFELASISERRMDQLLDPKKSNLPPFLAKDSGLESGYMIVQYSAGAALAELHGHANPRTAFSTSTSAGQEDHVSMGATACWNLYQACIRLSEVLACELLIASEAITYHDYSPSPTVQSLISLVRNISPILDSDRSTSEELMQIAEHLRMDHGWQELKLRISNYQDRL